MRMQFQSACVDLNQAACAGSASVFAAPPAEKRRARHHKRLEATMAEPDGNGISARLWRLPGQLLLALINATAILVIVAALVTLVAIARINHFAENVTATMTEAVLSKVDLPERDVLANIRNLTAEVRTLGNTLREIKDGGPPALQPELAKLKEALTVLNVSIDRIGNARSILTDEAIGQLGRTVTDGLMKLRDCSSTARPAAGLATRMARQPSPSYQPSFYEIVFSEDRKPPERSK
jgi:hypothetical protein